VRESENYKLMHNSESCMSPFGLRFSPSLWFPSVMESISEHIASMVENASHPDNAPYDSFVSLILSIGR
jgi:hypothetical protein